MHIEDMSNQIKQMTFRVIFFALIFLDLNFYSYAEESPQTAPRLGFRVVRTLPHDTAHYTEGLVFHDGKIFESAGRYGVSALYEKDLETGKILRKRANNSQDFAEGLAIIGKKIVQLTWLERTGFIYDLALRPIGQMHYDTEGWGLASIAKEKLLVMSDGSSTLHFLDAKSFREQRRISVHAGAHEITQLNELEVADGLIYANIWLTDLIAVIDPSDGLILAWLDLSPLKASFKKPSDWNEREYVLNGIAHDYRTGHFFVTGKCWPLMFELAIERVAIPSHIVRGAATPQ